MRAIFAAFSLVSILVVVAILLLVESQNISGIQGPAKDARTKAEVIAGRVNDIASTDSAVLTPQRSGSDVTAIAVTSIVPGGPLAAYGLQKGDRIVEVGPFRVRDDPDMAKAMIYEAPQRQLPMVLIRSNERVTLTGEKIGQPVTVNKTPAPGSPAAAPGGSRSGSGDPIKDQIDLHALPGMP